MASRTLALAGVIFALALATPARADVPPDPPEAAPTSARPSGATPKAKRSHAARPIVSGLLAALLLIVAAAAGANDKPRKAT